LAQLDVVSGYSAGKDFGGIVIGAMVGDAMPKDLNFGFETRDGKRHH
jgi:hypothetical protein